MSRFAVHRFAQSTVAVATVTLIAGALTTSKNAGMAFRDWPTSDGQFMLTYPWLADFARNWDKFLEHGHRLAGALIGLWSIALVVIVSRHEPRRWVRGLACSILGGVIIQGLLGGFRVQLDARGLAALHGGFAAVVLSLMGMMCTVLHPSWRSAGEEPRSAPAEPRTDLDDDRDSLSLALFSGVLSLVLLAVQFALGSLVRHHGRALHEHLGLGIAVGVFVLFAAFSARGLRRGWVRQSAAWLAGVVLLQVLLGAGAWIAKFGLAAWGVVAVADSIVQVGLRSAHAVLGILLMMSAAVHVLRLARLQRVLGREGASAARHVAPRLASRELPLGGAP